MSIQKHHDWRSGFLAFILFISSFAFAHSQEISPYLDSLEKSLSLSQENTAKVKLLRDLCWEFGLEGQMRKSVQYGNQAVKLAEKINDQKGLAGAYNDLGYIYYSQREYQKSLKLHLKSEAIYKKIKDQRGLASAYGNLANLFCDQSDYPRGLEYYFKCLKIQEGMNDSINMAISYSNIGNVYSAQESFDLALNYYRLAEKVQLKTGDERGLGKTCNNIGILYKGEHLYDEALNYYQKSLAIKLKFHDQIDIASCYNNLAELYIEIYDQSDSIRSAFAKKTGVSNTALIDFAESYLLKSLAISEKVSDEYSIAVCCAYLGEVYSRRKAWQKSISSCNRALSLAEAINAFEVVQTACKRLSENYRELKDFEKAYDYYRKLFEAKEMVKNDENTKAVTRKEMEYRFEKEQEIQRQLQYKKEIESREELRREKLFRNFFVGGFILVALLAVVILRNLRQKKRSAAIIEKQKALVEEKNREIVDSINYARRLQEAILPTKAVWKKYLPESFVYYRPKDIVAGDFYWIVPLEKQNLVLFAAADCTGHGVPGAMVSVVCSNALNQAVKEFSLVEPGKILDKVCELVDETFGKIDSGQIDVRDGMDISLCSWNYLTNEIRWAGANNPIWYIKNNSSSEEMKLEEIKADKQPIGKYENRKHFTTHQLQLQKGDFLYLFTDGYADQFNEDGKKFKSSRLKETLFELSRQPIDSQMQILNTKFETWKKSIEQIDDVCVIGIRI